MAFRRSDCPCYNIAVMRHFKPSLVSIILASTNFLLAIYFGILMQSNTSETTDTDVMGMFVILAFIITIPALIVSCIVDYTKHKS